jgi:hypothetical protein
MSQAEGLLWQGKVDETIAIISPLKAKQAQNFCQYLKTHRAGNSFLAFGKLFSWLSSPGNLTSAGMIYSEIREHRSIGDFLLFNQSLISRNA